MASSKVGRSEVPAGLPKESTTLFKLALDDRDTVEEVTNLRRVTDAIVCFHAQQAIEKVLKAVLVANGASVSHEHSISGLMGDLRAAGTPLAAPLFIVARFDKCAVKLRYEDVPSGGLGIPRADMLSLVDAVMAWAVDAVA
jgi:HEPN domain-containing protein